MLAGDIIQGKLQTITNNGLTWIDIQKPTRNNLEDTSDSNTLFTN